MSENETLEKLVQEMRSLRKIAANQQETLQGISQLLQGHTRALRMHQKIIEALADQAGITFTSPDDILPNDPVN